MSKNDSVNIVWIFLASGIVSILAGIFVDQTVLSASLQKAEIFSGGGLLIAAIVALLVI